jgi:hypothetical protein
MAVTKRIRGWIDVVVQHPQATQPYYQTRKYVENRTKKEIKEDIISYLTGFGLPLVFVKTFKIKITHGNE